MQSATRCGASLSPSFASFNLAFLMQKQTRQPPTVRFDDAPLRGLVILLMAIVSSVVYG
jgi:hypothetical protein